LKNNRLLSISILVLSISIVFGSIWLGRSIEKLPNTSVSGSPLITEKGLFTESESAEYLNISPADFNNILLNDQKTKSQLTSYPTYKFIPYIELSDGNKRFSKKELDEWIKYNSLNK
jgi:hypothetical protein